MKTRHSFFKYVCLIQVANICYAVHVIVSSFHDRRELLRLHSDLVSYSVVQSQFLQAIAFGITMIILNLAVIAVTYLRYDNTMPTEKPSGSQ